MASEKDTKSFSFDVMAAVFAVLQKKNINLGKKDLELMEDLMKGLDTKRTASSLDHAFRPVKHRAKELLEKEGAEDDAKTSPKKPKPSKGAKAGVNGGVSKICSKKPSKYSIGIQGLREMIFLLTVAQARARGSMKAMPGVLTRSRPRRGSSRKCLKRTPSSRMLGVTWLRRAAAKSHMVGDWKTVGG